MIATTIAAALAVAVLWLLDVRFHLRREVESLRTDLAIERANRGHAERRAQHEFAEERTKLTDVIINMRREQKYELGPEHTDERWPNGVYTIEPGLELREMERRRRAEEEEVAEADRELLTQLGEF